ncbi:MAG: SusC/RagA family TonB-linked outer membrane protein, partial [Bacteroidales bacterium]
TYESLVPGDYKFLDYNADGNLTYADMYPVKGSYYPPLTASFSGGFSYKGFNFSFLTYGVSGKWINSYEYFETAFRSNNWKIRPIHVNHWTPAKQTGTYCSPAYGVYKLAWMSRGIVDRTWRRADYIRLKELYIGYKFPSGFMNRTFGVSGVEIFLNGFNLLTFTVLENKDLDPETLRAQDWNSGWYPQTKTIKYGLRVTF